MNISYTRISYIYYILEILEEILFVDIWYNYLYFYIYVIPSLLY